MGLAKSHLTFMASALTILLTPCALAEPDIVVTLDAGLSTQLIDRGETLAMNNAETAITVETTLGNGALYGSIYRISPLGTDDEAFDEEVDYTIGYAFEGQGWAADVSANYLTYAGNNEDASLELAGFIELDTLFAPSLTAFYDADFEDFGAEAALTHAWEVGDFSPYAMVRAGFVTPKEGGDYTYGGVELGAEYPLSETLALSGFARFEAADEDTFAGRVSGGEVLTYRSEGSAIGVALSLSIGG